MLWNKKEKTSDVVEITDKNFEVEVTKSELPVFLDFWAPWCGPCKVMNPIIEEIASEFKGRVVVGKVNVDHNPNLGNFFNIKSIPTFMFIKNGRLIESMSTLIPKPNLEEMLVDLINLNVVFPSSEEE